MDIIFCTNRNKHEKTVIHLPMIDRVYLWPVSMYSITIVNATVVRLSVVYMGTFTPLTDAIEASFQEIYIEQICDQLLLTGSKQKEKIGRSIQ